MSETEQFSGRGLEVKDSVAASVVEVNADVVLVGESIAQAQVFRLQ